MSTAKSNKPELFVDNEKFDWNKPTITGAELRDLASIPEGVQIYQHVPGHPDREISSDTVIDLAQSPAPERFSTQSTGSQAG